MKINNLEKKSVGLTKPARHHFSLDLIHLSFLLRQKGKCSYASISRIIEVLGACGLVDLARVPCANTIQNWVSKMGLNELENGYDSLPTSHVSLVVDESIKIGEEKLLVVLCSDSDKSHIGTLVEPPTGKTKVIGEDLGIYSHLKLLKRMSFKDK